MKKSLQKESWVKRGKNSYGEDEIKQVNRMKKGNAEYGKEGAGGGDNNNHDKHNLDRTLSGNASIKSANSAILVLILIAK